MSLPTPTTTRWQPLRTGLVDLFYYDRQDFWFRDGRILFRGNNGTGKSKVLALTMPLLLDGDLTPSRVEPDGDRAKKMEWNLLLGGRYDERLGYTFLEFGRVAEDGEHAYLTIGIGLKAVAGRGIADKWFFVTSQRVGEDLALVGPSGTALTHDRLREAVGAYGTVTKTATEYRRMVDEHLFHLGTDRYDSLINLLIQLRQPQLSKKPDEGKLSKALSDALTPVDQAVLSDVAAAFHDLEQQRDELTGLRDTRREVGRFLGRYRDYARIAARRTGGDLRTRHAAYERIGREIGDVDRRKSEAAETERQAFTELGALRREQAEQTAVKEELTSDPRLKNLADAQRYAGAADRDARTAADTARRAAETRTIRAGERDTAARAADRTRQAIDPSTVLAHAETAGVSVGHAEAVGPLNLPDGPLTDDLERRVRQRAKAAADHRAAAVAQLRDLIAKADREAAELRELRGKLAQAEADRDEAADRVGDARTDLLDAAEQHVEDWRGYTRSLTVLGLPDPDETPLPVWTETLDGPHPMRALLRAAASAAEGRLAEETVALKTESSAAARDKAALEAERADLEGGVTARPPVPHTRGAAARRGPGAALWQVVDFAPGLAETAKAGLEAALEAAGLLDAWVTFDGRLVDGHDTVLVAGPPTASALSSALVASFEPGCPVPVRIVEALLSSIGLGPSDGPAWVAVDGRWRLGPAHGAWTKPAAAFIGHAAREEARRLRIADLTAAITELDARIATLSTALKDVTERRRALRAEQDREPQDQELRDAHGTVTATTRELVRLQQRADGLATDAGFKEDDLRRVLAVRDETAADLRLPADAVALDQVTAALADYRQALSELLSAARVHAASLHALDGAERRLAEADTLATEAESDALEKAERAAQERSRLETLQEAIGASVEELRARLAAATARLSELTREISATDIRHRQALELKFKAEGRAEQLADQLAEATVHRDEAVADLERFATTGLLALACDLPLPETWAATNAVELARRAEGVLHDVEAGDDAWQRVQDGVSRRFNELADALSRLGHTATAGLGEWFTVTIQFQGRERPPADLAALLEDEIAYHDRILSGNERDLLEEHLVNDVAVHLQELIGDAEAQVRRMNDELADRPTSTGMKLRLLWRPAKNGPEGLAEARKRLLRQNPDLWSGEDRTAVGAFLHSLIEAQRAADEQGTWHEHLRRALDYRCWHDFGIERYQDGQWRPGTGPASGGERVLTVSLPLFAAASSQYRSAHPHAPRLVALDEAFAGVDDDARAKCLGLLAAFDLDVVMTSEREWGFYETVPGLAAHHLVRHDGIDAVHVTHWEWDGRAPHRVTEDVPPPRAGLF